MQAGQYGIKIFNGYLVKKRIRYIGNEHDFIAKISILEMVEEALNHAPHLEENVLSKSARPEHSIIKMGCPKRSKHLQVINEKKIPRRWP